MSLTVKRKQESSVPPMEPGVYFAVCVGIVDIGHQYNETYKKSAAKVLLIFEIPSERVEIDGVSKPRWISATYTNSLSKKAKLADMLVSWRGKNFTDEELRGFDLSTMLGQPATVQIVQNENNGAVYANIVSVTGLPKGTEAPKAENELLLYNMDAPDDEVFAKLPGWVQEKIKASDEYGDKAAAEKTLDVDPMTGEVVEEDCPI